MWQPAAGPARVDALARVRARGKVAPLTLEGSLVVDGVWASAYATHGLVSQRASHAALAPLRALWRAWPAALKALHRDGVGCPAVLAAGHWVLAAAARLSSV